MGLDLDPLLLGPRGGSKLPTFLWILPNAPHPPEHNTQTLPVQRRPSNEGRSDKPLVPVDPAAFSRRTSKPKHAKHAHQQPGAAPSTSPRPSPPPPTCCTFVQCRLAQRHDAPSSIRGGLFEPGTLGAWWCGAPPLSSLSLPLHHTPYQVQLTPFHCTPQTHRPQQPAASS